MRNDRKAYPVTSRAAWLAMREVNIGASDVGALFGLSPHKTALQLWAERSGRLPPDTSDSMAMRRGRILEPAVAAALREAHPEWAIRPANIYFELTGSRLGATPDFYAWTSMAEYEAGATPTLIQAKTVLAEVYEEEWTPAPPAHYLMQCQAEMLASGLQACILAALVLDGREYPIREYAFTADEEIQASIEKAARRFWDCVATGVEPAMKPAQDGATFGALYPSSDETIQSLHGDGVFVALCEQYEAAQKAVKKAEEAKEEAATRIKERLRNHLGADARDYRVRWPSMPGGTRVQNVKPHRRLTVTRRKGA